MVAISTSAVTAQRPILPPPSPKAEAQDTAAAPPTSDPVDTVTLSNQARQILDGKAPAPPADPSPPTQDQIATAVAALNDTSGKTAVGDQLNAYALLTNILAKGQVLLDNRLPPATPPPGGMMSEAAAQAALVSSFSQRLNQVLATVDSQRDPDTKYDETDPTTFTGKAATAFNALSADDQQIYVAAKTLSKSLGADDTPSARPPDGSSPPDVKAITDALAKVDDGSGGVMGKDQIAALNLLNGDVPAGGGPAGQAVAMNAAASPFAARRAQTQTLVEKYLVPGEDPYPQMLDNLNKLSPEDQATYFSTRSKASDGTVLFGSLDSLKDNLTTRESMLTLYNQVTQAYGVSDLTQLKTLAQKNNPALQKLETLFRADQESDAWTAQVKDFLSHTTMADLGLAPVGDDGDPDMAKALETLEAVLSDARDFAKAIKTGKGEKWEPITEAKKHGAKVQQAADPLGAAKAEAGITT
ncbi:hypothetical protein [Phenylobacterium sp.]|uniref:hypothetical protein n=1 Tax=Phenylobacterium sp. TaxID=1871053 RepID=UPI0035639C9D